MNGTEPQQAKWVTAVGKEAHGEQGSQARAACMRDAGPQGLTPVRAVEVVNFRWLEA